MIQILYQVPQFPENAKTYSYRAPMPIRRACPTVGPPFALSESETWNCNLCGADQEFFIPYLRGDIIPFQTNFADNYNANPAVLNAGIKSLTAADWYVIIELQDGTGTTVSDLANVFCSAYYVGYDQMFGSIQTWFVNTGLFPISLKCWRLKITYLKINQLTTLVETERVLFTEYYKELICSDSVSITSSYSAFDCYSNNYNVIENSLGVGTNETYYNFLRLEGEVEFIARNEEVLIQTDRNKVIRKRLTKVYRISTSLIAPFYAKMLDRAFAGKDVFVDNLKYMNFTFDKSNEASRMWAVTPQFEEECNVDNRGCGL